jgi:predicted DNA-binding transcriptional regulator AlpA
MMSAAPPVQDVLIPARRVRQIAGGISNPTLWRWIKSGKIPTPIHHSGRNFWRSSVIQHWLTEIEQNEPTRADAQNDAQK